MYQYSNCIPRTEFGGYYGFGLVAPPRRRATPPRPPPQRFSCERSTGCSSSRIIFKWRCVMVKRRRQSFLVWAKSSLPWWQHFFGGNILEPVTSAVFTRLSWNLAHRTNITWRCEKFKFSELLRQELPWQPHISGKIISFSFSFCSFCPISDHLQIWQEGALW